MVKERLGTHVLCDARACYVKSIPKLIYLNELGQCILILASSSTPVFNQSASYLWNLDTAITIFTLMQVIFSVNIWHITQKFW